MKLFDSFFQDPKIKKLKRMPGGDTYIVIMLKLMLQTIKTDGLYEFEHIENSLAEELELKLDEDVKAIQVVLDYMASHGLIVQIQTNYYQIPQVQKMIGSETASTQRSRKSREKKQQLLQCNITATNSNTELEKELELTTTTQYIEIKKNDAYQIFISYFPTSNMDEFNHEFKKFHAENPLDKTRPATVGTRTQKNWQRWCIQLQKFNKQWNR